VKKDASCEGLIMENEKPSLQKVESADFPEENTRRLRSLSQKSRKGRIQKKLAHKSKKNRAKLH
jgi:hypothetical protein